jgi:cytochrome c biogenesis protein CcmG/thiol:disulfide interchange protein DsbE
MSLQVPRILQKGASTAAGALCAAALLLPAGALAAVRGLVVPVSGMTCALCTRGVEESIKQAEGVGGVAADLATGRVRVDAAEGKSLNIREVKERVVRAGFKVAGECDVIAAGRFQIGIEGRINFRVADGPALYQVLEGNELRRMIRAYPGLKREFVVAFRLHDHPNWKPAAVSILSFEAVPPPARPAEAAVTPATAPRNRGAAAPAADKTTDRFAGLVLEDLHGRRVRFADFRGKVRVFDIWATWCGPCRMGIPLLNGIYDRYRTRGLVIVGIAVDSTPADIAEFQQEIPLHYPSALATPEIEDLFGPTESIPTTFVVDRRGVVVKRFVGFVDPRVLEREIQRLL